MGSFVPKSVAVKMAHVRQWMDRVTAPLVTLVCTVRSPALLALLGLTAPSSATVQLMEPVISSLENASRY